MSQHKDWGNIKDKYSHSTYFDNIYDIRELDKDIEDMIRSVEKETEEAYKLKVLNVLDKWKTDTDYKSKLLDEVYMVLKAL